ncbi:MAG: hypothetical protein JXB14_08210 [Candidatus Altiarchaeota archaeon]|nr:hypothetical protein [Candidatus Altiarchaeota archaeon]
MPAGKGPRPERRRLLFRGDEADVYLTRRGDYRGIERESHEGEKQDLRMRYLQHRIAHIIFPQHFFEMYPPRIDLERGKLILRSRFIRPSKTYRDAVSAFYKSRGVQMGGVLLTKNKAYAKHEENTKYIQTAGAVINLENHGIFVNTHPVNIMYRSGAPYAPLFTEIEGIRPETIRDRLDVLNLPDAKRQDLVRFLRKYEQLEKARLRALRKK